MYATIFLLIYLGDSLFYFYFNDIAIQQAGQWLRMAVVWRNVNMPNMFIIRNEMTTCYLFIVQYTVKQLNMRWIAKKLSRIVIILYNSSGLRF